MAEFQLDRRRESADRDAEILRRLTGLESQIGECSKRINGRIEERIGEHSAIRGMQEQIESIVSSFNDLKETVQAAIGNGDKRLKGHDEDIDELRARIAGLEKAISDIKSQIAQIEHIARSNTEAINSLSSQIMRNQIVVLEAIGTLNKSINSIANVGHQEKTAKGAIKSPFVWTAGGVIAVIQLAVGIAYYVLTGDSTILDGAK